MYLTADSLIKISKIITVSNNIAFRKVNVKPYGFDKIYNRLINQDLHIVLVDHLLKQRKNAKF